MWPDPIGMSRPAGATIPGSMRSWRMPYKPGVPHLLIPATLLKSSKSSSKLADNRNSSSWRASDFGQQGNSAADLAWRRYWYTVSRLMP